MEYRVHYEDKTVRFSDGAEFTFRDLAQANVNYKSELAELKREKAMLKDQLKLAQQKCDDIKIEARKKDKFIEKFYDRLRFEHLHRVELDECWEWAEQEVTKEEK